MPRKTIYETIFKGVVFGSFFGIAYFAVDGLLKLADDQQELLGEMLSQCEELEEKLSQCKEAVN